MKIRMKFNPPYPTLGRQLQIIARVLDTDSVPGITKKLEHLANDPSINLDSLIDAIEQVFKLPFEYPNFVFSNKTCEEFIQQLKENFFTINQNLITSHHPENFSNQKALYKSFIPFICELIYAFVKELFKDNDFTNKILLMEAPFQYGLNVILKKCPQFIDCFHYSERDKVRRWIAGKQFPKMGDLFDIINKAKDALGDHYIQCCEIAFVSQLLQETAKIAEPVYKIQVYFKSIIENSSNNEDFKPDNIHLEKLFKLQSCFICTQNEIRDCVKENRSTNSVLDRFAKVCANLKISSNVVKWRYNLLLVLSLIYQGNFNEALKTLKIVMPNLFYATNIIDTACYIDFEKKNRYSFFKIALALGAICEDRPFLKMMKTYGIVFGLFGKPMDIHKDSYNNIPYVNKDSRSKDVIVEDWEVEQWANDFFYLFSEKDVKNIDSIKSKKTDVHLPLSIELGKEPKVPVKPYKTPFRISWKTYPQLVWFSQMCNIDAVKVLLDAKVNVNKLSSSGESALSSSIEHMVVFNDPFEPEKGKELFHLLASHPHKQETILTPTNKKRKTCLGQAILTGEIEIVKKLIEMGADVNQIQSTDQQSPLYSLVQFSGKSNFPNTNSQQYLSPEILDGFRRQHEFLRSKNNDEVRQWISCNWGPQEGFVEKELKKLYEERIEKYLSKEKIFSIARVLLENGANPNLEHNVGKMQGYTPLMFAAEKDSLDLFKLMLEYRGDPLKRCRVIRSIDYKSVSCWEIADFWKSNSILQYLKENWEPLQINKSSYIL